jgi:hypothetical protein
MLPLALPAVIVSMSLAGLWVVGCCHGHVDTHLLPNLLMVVISAHGVAGDQNMGRELLIRGSCECTCLCMCSCRMPREPHTLLPLRLVYADSALLRIVSALMLAHITKVAITGAPG